MLALRGECFLDQGTGFPQLGSSPVMVGTQLNEPLLDPGFGFCARLGDLIVQRVDFGAGVFVELLQLGLRLAGQFIELRLDLVDAFLKLCFRLRR